MRLVRARLLLRQGPPRPQGGALAPLREARRDELERELERLRRGGGDDDDDDDDEILRTY